VFFFLAFYFFRGAPRDAALAGGGSGDRPGAGVEVHMIALPVFLAMVFGAERRLVKTNPSPARRFSWPRRRAGVLGRRYFGDAPRY